MIEVIGFRIKSEDKRLVEEVSDARGEDVSDFVRRAVYHELATLNYLPPSKLKALGLKTKQAPEGAPENDKPPEES